MNTQRWKLLQGACPMRSHRWGPNPYPSGWLSMRNGGSVSPESNISGLPLAEPSVMPRDIEGLRF